MSAEQFEEKYNSRYTLVARLSGPIESPAKSATPEHPEVPAYAYFEARSSVYFMEKGEEIKASVHTENVVTDEVEVAKAKAFATARFWAATSL